MRGETFWLMNKNCELFVNYYKSTIKLLKLIEVEWHKVGTMWGVLIKTKINNVKKVWFIVSLFYCI